MNILLLSIYGKNDARTRMFIRILRKMGNLICVSKRVEEKTDDVNSPNDIEIEYQGIRDIGRFICAAYNAKKRLKNVDLLFLDNRMACIPFFLFGRKCRYVIQDAREFYSIHEVSHLAGKIGCIVEKRALKKVDMVICANKQRAQLMKTRFNLSALPFVFENIFPAKYDDFFDPIKTENDYGHYFNSEKMVFISSSGCQIERTTDKLVLAARKFAEKMDLLLVGGSAKKDVDEIKKIIKNNSITNVSIIDQVDTNTLKYLMSKSDVGVVIYGKHDENNRYCASGKIYEYLYEKLPMITSDNEPLVDFVNSTHTGIASNDYEEAIQLMLEHYPEYKSSVNEFYESFDPEYGNKLLENEIRQRLKKARITL